MRLKVAALSKKGKTREGKKKKKRVFFLILFKKKKERKAKKMELFCPLFITVLSHFILFGSVLI